jgi:hypothetical protein
MRAPATHLEALRRFDFDTVLTPYNYRLSLESDYRRDFQALLEAVRTADAALMLIKTLARNLWKTGEEPSRTTWYEPLEEEAAVDAAVAFALAVDGVTGIATPGDVGLLGKVLRAEGRRSSLSDEDAAETLATVPDMEPPFVRRPGRQIPEWLEPVVS